MQRPIHPHSFGTSETGRRRPARRLLAALAVTALASLSVAQTPPSDASPVALELTAFRVVVEAGEQGPVERLVPALSAGPGDVLEWRLEARNDGSEGVASVTLELPVPATAVYQADSAAAWFVPTGAEPRALDPLALSYSADGGLSFGPAPLTREQVETVEGETVTTLVVVPPSEYTQVRLTLPFVASGERYLLTLRAEVP